MAKPKPKLKEKPPEPEILGGNGTRGADGHQKRISRYGAAKERTLEILEEVKRQAERSPHGQNGVYWPKEKNLLANCGNTLLFRHYYQFQNGQKQYEGQPKLSNVITCKRHLLCQLCAILRETRYHKKALPILRQILAENPNLRPYLLTLTVPNEKDLLPPFLALLGGHGELLRTRRNQKSTRSKKQTEFAKIAGGLVACEVKKGKQKNLWHPHLHMLILCDPDNLPFVIDERMMYGMKWYRNPQDMPPSLNREWWELTGGLSIDLRPINPKPGDEDDPDGLFNALCEVVKYGCKFPDMHPREIMHVYETLKGRRLISSFGNLYGIKPPEAGPDDDHPQDMLFDEYFYRYVRAAGYNLERIFCPQTGQEVIE